MELCVREAVNVLREAETLPTAHQKNDARAARRDHLRDLLELFAGHILDLHLDGAQ
jgi:hypothetical protein